MNEQIAMIWAYLGDAMDWARLLPDDGLIKGHVVQHLESASEAFKAMHPQLQEHFNPMDHEGMK